MRTTVTLADDVAAAVSALRDGRGIGLSEAVNELVRAGLTERPAARPFVQETHDLGSARIDLDNIGEVLELIEGPAHR